MATEIKTELNIVDLWYDFYARFLPGFVFLVVLFLCGLFGDPQITIFLNINIIILIFIFSLVIGLCTQPLASRIVNYIEQSVDSSPQKYFIRQIQKVIGFDQTPSRILDKMHGETAFFAQIAIYSFINAILCSTNCYPSIPQKCIVCSLSLVVMIISIIFAYWISKGRYKRAEEYKNIFKIDDTGWDIKVNSENSPHQIVSNTKGNEKNYKKIVLYLLIIIAYSLMIFCLMQIDKKMC